MLVIITGASSGIGEALSLNYAKAGHTLCLLSRTRSELERVASLCREAGSIADVYCVDVSDAPGMERVGLDILSKHGTPDLVIANAGIRIEDPVSYVASSAAQDVMQVNYFGVINTFAPFIASMIERRCGHLVAISSIGAIRATPNSGIYSASKAAVNLWTEALRLKLAPHNIVVTTAASGFVRTAMTNDLTFFMPGILEPSQAATIISDAVAHRRGRITFPWQSSFIWGVFGLLPGGLYDTIILLAKKYWPKRRDSMLN
jgi:short-subunit dehydrogenase